MNTSRLDIVQHWVTRSLHEVTEIQPALLVATPEASCNLACAHCYWRHDLKQTDVDWNDSVQKILQLIKAQAAQGGIFSVASAGRIMSKRAAEFVKTFLQIMKQAVEKGEILKDDFSLGIIDNGYTIFNNPEFLPVYEYINISVDGWKDAHDVQRRKEGSFDVAWKAILRLKSLGYDPIAASAVGPLSIPSWNKFDELLAEHNIRSSVALVWDMEATLARGSACIKDESDILTYFEKLISGVPRLVNLYDKKHVRILKPLLKDFHWSIDSSGNGLFTETPNGSHILYRPVSISLFRECELLWDGKFVTTEGVGRSPLEHVTPSHFQKVHEMALLERDLWEGIPIY